MSFVCLAILIASVLAVGVAVLLSNDPAPPQSQPNIATTAMPPTTVPGGSVINNNTVLPPSDTNVTAEDKDNVSLVRDISPHSIS